VICSLAPFLAQSWFCPQPPVSIVPIIGRVPETAAAYGCHNDQNPRPQHEKSDIFLCTLRLLITLKQTNPTYSSQLHRKPPAYEGINAHKRMFPCKAFRNTQLPSMQQTAERTTQAPILALARATKIGGADTTDDRVLDTGPVLMFQALVL
jgi:hypothetical protein